ncbi:MAG: ribonuclease E activity regulator RraA [Arcobacter sp.]|jgi:regulator of ribonuclease activity A|uniref:ribonuclease E activity regulator RraA n=1 Tax=Arcobacter sp. TaxID=1872629 RepID=UPI00258CE2AA|nr:ribonuclease E activity regulator RraA [Arcobacter sp.]MDD3008547.1 ribonuclease E activity regulator RraA [Arcobacter sp.]MDY3204201.1 ribonuclease E activity regulator RraA [Arcobacter sp.]
MGFFTADLCDEFSEKVQILGPDFKSYGGNKKFRGEVITVKLEKNNKDLATFLKNNDGTGKVVVVDVNMRYFAVVGDNLMRFAADNKYEGIIVNGYVRDTINTKDFEIGLLAKGTCPRKYIPVQDGQIGVPLVIDDVEIYPGDYIYVDVDGIVISKEKLV